MYVIISLSILRGTSNSWKMDAAKSKEVADEYISSLADLSVNSKPMISMLTILAEESMKHAPAIVHAVEAHLQKVKSDCKLPVLYLIDSIVKNVKGNYLELFSQNIVKTFCSVFEEVDEATRLSMHKLRQTWFNVFPAQKLYVLDLKVNSIDPAWPIRPLPTSGTSSIHVNPRFFAMSRHATAEAVPVAATNLPSTNNVLSNEAAMREQLLKKERELLELQKKKIELELLQAKASLEQQQRQLYKQVVNLKTEPSPVTVLMSPSNENTQEKLVVSSALSKIPNTTAKQFPAATASLLKNVGTSNGPRIAPASSIAVASARPMLRDPRLKISTSAQEQSTTQVDPRHRAGITGEKEPCMEQQAQAVVPVVNTVLSEQLKQQLLLKQAVVTSSLNKPPSIADGSNTSLLIASSNNNANSNLNINNKNSSGNANKDAVSHRKSQKKEPRSSSNSSGNLTVNNSKATQNQSVNNSSSPVSSVSSRGGGGSESKLKDAKSPKNRGSSMSENDKSSASSHSSHRKLGNKSRSKQPHSSPSKIPKIDRDSSPVRSKSREKENEDSSPSLRASPQSYSQSSKSRKKINNSRKRSPSPYRIPRRNELKSNTSSSSSGGLTEEEQSGSLIVSPPHPPTFKEIRPAARQRNYVRRNREGSPSPEPTASPAPSHQALSVTLLASSSKDEDLRASLPIQVPTAPSSISEKKEDLDLRVLPPVTVNKRQSSEHVEPSIAKKSKVEKFDALFGNEDVDLRMLTNPNAGRPPTPPPPVISGDEGKDSWAKLKTPSKSNDRDKSEKPLSEDKRDRDRSRDPLGRPRLYNKLPDDPKERRRTLSNDEQDPRFSRRGRDTDKHERNPERNIEIILKQAAEQLSQGAITKADYNKLIQEVLHMSEVQKLKAAQRQEKEVGSLVWEKGTNMDMKNRMPGFPIKDEHHRNDYPSVRNEGGPRWQNQPWQRPGPWAHPAGPPFGGPQGHFNPDYRPLGPWQNPRHFSPIRPDFQFHGGFNPNLGPRMGPGMMGPMGPNGPIMTNMIPNGPLGPLGMGNAPLPISGMGPGSMMMNGPMGKMMHPNIAPVGPPVRNSSPSSTPKYEHDQNEDDFNGVSIKNASFNRELPIPDQKVLDEISHDVMRSINIDGIPREIRYYGHTAVVFLSWDDPREIGFQDGVRRVLIDEIETINCEFNEPFKEFHCMGEVHRIKLGGPTRELYVDDCWYECYFGGPAISINLGGKKVSVKLEGPSPQVKIGTVKRTDLVVAKINLIINAKNMVPVFLDAKPQIFEIEGTPHTLEFIDALQTVLLNGRPFKVEFGGLPKPIIVRDKKHFIRFSVLPRGIRAGYVRIMGMRGEGPVDSPPVSPRLNQNVIIENAPASVSLPSTIEHDSASQDGSDFISTTSKPDLQLDMLSSVLPSAMAPSSGLSYQAEPVENPPAPPPVLNLNLNMDELFQRLVETGIVANLSEPKKQEETEKEKPEIIPVSFSDDKSLKVKQPAVIGLLFNGMQCSSCGSRYATPELTSRYSQHLDWHFRQNRKERDSARKAHSRTFYYDLSDWTQYEEVEDLEDRAQSWFETEKQSTEVESAVAEDVPEESEQPSVPTGSATELRCHVCHDEFKQFYNEEMEEWHIKPAVVFEDNYFHPLCLEDHKRALEKSAEALEALVVSEEGKNLATEVMDNSVEVKEKEAEETKEVKFEEAKADEIDEIECVVAGKDSVVEADPDIVVTEPPPAPVIESIDLESEENELEVVGSEQPAIEQKKTVDELERIDQPLDKIKIKEEPLDEAEIPEEEFVFTNIEVKEEPIEAELEPEPEESIEPIEVDTTHAAMKSSIDGNVELESTPTTIPAAPSKIKINITKPLAAIREPEEQKGNPVIESFAVENSRPLSPATVKNLLKSRNLKVYPKVEKGEEMSGLCSIM
ncbi:uncharacterized protein LOC117170223 isoform X2 [Belonocnema kinseyi]|uniref:uncharacterized protein LOC117170223 isoform X2 n=1 Tax=Belonocnema kinseyi TaxID=2817044 RepID=UPI00143D4F04|nr:uncharacterized protein LOC117170223 isoform X2 [Belonocnema kinseyi]